MTTLATLWLAALPLQTVLNQASYDVLIGGRLVGEATAQEIRIPGGGTKEVLSIYASFGEVELEARQNSATPSLAGP